MADGNDTLPSDQEDGGLKPRPERKPDTTKLPPDDKNTEEDPSEQPS